MPLPKRTAVGLINRANDCFANANLQALAGCPNLYSYLHQLIFICPERKLELLLLSKTVSSLCLQLNEPVYTPTSTSIQPVISAIEHIHKSHLSRSQHDAHEMLHLLLETLQTEAQTLCKLLPGVVPAFPFEGLTVDTITCKSCGYTKEVQEASFLVLTLTVPMKRGTHIQALVEKFLQTDTISEYNCPQCQCLQDLKKSPASPYREFVGTQTFPELPLPPANSPIEKSTRFRKLPESLAIHLNRSIYSGGAQRNSCKVAIPEYLELSDEKVTRKYKLCALQRHSGTHALGHYECARRKNFEFWRLQNHQFDDTEFMSISSSSSRNYAASIGSTRSLASLGSAKSENSDLPFPAPATPQASIQPAQAEVKIQAPSQIISPQQSHSVPLSPQAHHHTPKPQGPKFWNISDTVVKESTFGQAVSNQSSNYLVFYEKVRDIQIKSIDVQSLASQISSLSSS